MSQAKDPVAVLGAGRLGLCWALCAEAAGHPVVAVDVFPAYVDAINSKRLVSYEPHVAEMLAASTRLRATSSVREAAESAKMLFVFVQTPSSGGERHYDHTHLSDVLCQLNALRLRDKHVVICCTVMPGYCATVAPELLRNCENVRVSYSPAFIAQGEIVAGLLAPDLVLIGAPCAASVAELRGAHESLLSSPRARAAQAARHGSAALAALRPPALRAMSPASAEIAKLALNCYVTLKIAFANFVADAADATDAANAAAAELGGDGSGALPEGAGRADKFQILEALGCDSRVGPKCLLPGYGFGGPCFPRDNRALAQHARALGVDVSVPEATDAANGAHARAQARAVCDGLAAAEAAAGAPPKGTLVRFRDVAYKPRCPVPIVQESQKLRVARLVREAGWAVVIVDRPAVLDAVRRDHGSLFRYRQPPQQPDGEAGGGGQANGNGASKKRAREPAEVDGESFLRLGGAQPQLPAEDGGSSAELGAEMRGEGRQALPTAFTK